MSIISGQYDNDLQGQLTQERVVGPMSRVRNCQEILATLVYVTLGDLDDHYICKADSGGPWFFKAAVVGALLCELASCKAVFGGQPDLIDGPSFILCKFILERLIDLPSRFNWGSCHCTMTETDRPARSL